MSEKEIPYLDIAHLLTEDSLSMPNIPIKNPNTPNPSLHESYLRILKKDAARAFITNEETFKDHGKALYCLIITPQGLTCRKHVGEGIQVMSYTFKTEAYDIHGPNPATIDAKSLFTKMLTQVASDLKSKSAQILLEPKETSHEHASWT